MKISLLLAGLLVAGIVTPAVYAQADAQPTPQPPPSPVHDEVESGFTVVGVSVRTNNKKEAGGAGEIPDIWQRTMQEGSLVNVPHRTDNNYTVVYTDYASDQNGDYTYILGVRVSSVDKLPENMISVNVPAGKYAVVDSTTGPLPEVMPKVWMRIAAMPATEMGGQRAFKADFEVYPQEIDWQNAQVAVHLGLK